MFRDLINEAYGAMRHNRRRTALTMLGMAWGIATVVMLLAYGDGFGQACANIFANFGTRLVIVAPGKTSTQAGGKKSGVQIRFTQDDIEALATNLPQITHITPSVEKEASVQYETRAFTFTVTGNDPTVFSIRSLKLDEGRFYNMQDQVQRGRVAVIGSEAKEKLFSGRNALGERIRLNGISFEVVGVLSAKMQEGNSDINRVVYIPFTTMSDLKDTHYLDSIWFNYNTPEYEKLEPAVRTILATQHKFNQTDHQAVEVFNLMMQVHQFEIITLGLKILMGFIGTLTLGIGGVGLMNIMLVSVTQRTREIGVQKALGAPRRYILTQFLAEALAITFVGGVLGVLLAYGVALSVGRLTLYSAFAKNGEAGDIRLIIAPGTLIASTLILGAVGLISGMIPAMRASRLDPIEALRHE
ncbi:MAG TPA: ABC transporter permease [Terriglobales bacterium]|jgi:putative ABC transport system permease protein|nr:ABC transporter permease [Terriglobales bacterium]